MSFLPQGPRTQPIYGWGNHPFAFTLILQHLRKLETGTAVRQGQVLEVYRAPILQETMPATLSDSSADRREALSQSRSFVGGLGHWRLHRDDHDFRADAACQSCKGMDGSDGIPQSPALPALPEEWDLLVGKFEGLFELWG